ncbi:hypothetical protein BDB00DRAFT_832939 [Zychaea mexicana]|uniref:uncharacterized protein n=1 Tax=Zychaea mexicana TaxID=64656 RepID=UPI0022FEBCD0|nr:uncharacterized protein BDB00DRAFT_832939 [Zychaea mexicana]KAI9491430.1 hypothetical protein BDB00DRAFT_832939 [Zychaea mexicana]
MSKRNSKRSLLRKEQSERDKMAHHADRSYYGHMVAFQHMLGVAKHRGYHDTSTVIPMELIDFTAVFIASLVNRYSSLPSSASEALRANVKFIRKTLARAQISCSSLILCLWYIDHLHPGCGNAASTISSNTNWTPRDLFVASVIVADKFLADVTWTNADWADFTQQYNCQEINRLEQRFLRDMRYKLFVPEQAYYDFCSYLEFRLTVAGQRGLTMIVPLSYRDIRVLSQSLLPVYVERLHLSLRPFEAMWLLAKTAASICAMYGMAVLTGYIVYQYAAAQVVSAVQYVLASYQQQAVLQEQMLVMVADTLSKNLVVVLPHNVE